MTVHDLTPDVPEGCGMQNNIDKFVVPHHFMYENEPHRFCELGTFGRLHEEMRLLLRGGTPLPTDGTPVVPPAVSAEDILETAARHLYNARFGRSGRIAREWYAFACADLAVTGSRVYFGKETADTPLVSVDFTALQSRIIGNILAEFPSAAETDIRSCIRDIYRRVFRVAWCLQGPARFRTLHRGSLGWIAVSGEDDPPHRPVNVDCTHFPQFNVNVELAAGSIRLGLPRADVSVNTRFVVASNAMASDTFPDEPEGLPVPAVFSMPPRVTGARDVILFIHGHSSRAEEFNDLAQPLLLQAAARGRQLVIISMDLPCCGYSEKIDSAAFVSPLAASMQRSGTPSMRFPCLQFFEKFIVRFIETLGLQDRLAAVIGGSLGGNMGLRLGRMSLDYLPNVVSWSAASVWDSFAEPLHLIDRVAKTLTLNSVDGYVSATSAEPPEVRAAYFHFVFVKLPVDVGVYSVPRQPDQWYRDSWQPCKQIHIENAILERQEIYHHYFRQMHWRIALEQLIFSHNLREMGSPLYDRNDARMFLLAGEKDNYDWTNIYAATNILARNMTTTPGQCFLVRDTGHSIHNERPAWFAREILNFLL